MTGTMIGHERRLPGLPDSASRRRLSRVGRKHSNGSVQSSSSSGTGRSTESVGIRQPAKNKIRRQRLSAVFGRGPRRDSAEVTDDPSELSNQISAPGILKIFGTEICEGANYKSVLATTHSSAKELVKEALARYCLSKEESDDYVLCDVIGCVENQRWRTECVRVVGDDEKPLLLQSLWKPREGFARRFEIQRKATVEENNSKDKDTVTAGINAQARKLQKTRSRGKSVRLDDGKHNMFKSLSETNLRVEAHKIRTEDPETEVYKHTQCPASEREETESSDDNDTQFSIHPPLDFPYFLLLQGFSYTQDFVIYPLIKSSSVFGRRVDQTKCESDSERLNLWAPDLLPCHCLVRRLDVKPETLLKPLDVNEKLLKPLEDNETLLKPLDVNETLLKPLDVNETLLKPLEDNETLLKPLDVNETLLKPLDVKPETLLKPLYVNETLLKPLDVNETLLKPLNVNETLLKPLDVNETLLKPLDLKPETLLKPLDMKPETLLKPLDMKPETLVKPLDVNETLLKPLDVNETLLKPLDVNETLLKPLDVKSEMLLKPLDVNETLLKPLDMKSETLLKPLDMKSETLLKPLDVKPEMLLKPLDVKPETLLKPLDVKPVMLLKPLNGAEVKRNGSAVRHEVELRSGDIISLGDHYLFMYKDPTSERPTLCQVCVLSEKSRRTRGFRDPDGAELALVYDVEHESRILEEIFSMVDQDKDSHKLSAAFLLCLCFQQSVNHFSMPALRRLLLHTANQLQALVWEKAKELAALQPEIHDLEAEERLIRGLEPLVLWMANSIEILHFIHRDLPRLLHGISQEEEDEEEDCIAVLELRLSSVRSASEEAMTVLEEVLMFTFQQCVYYLTKMLYPILPAFLDSDAFSESGTLHVPEDIRRVLHICTQTLHLLRVFQVHPQILQQLFAYIFFFINALLFNLLMERGSGGTFFHWSRGVRIRANLDLLMDWCHSARLGDLAHGFLLKISSAVNLLATPRQNLLQMCWTALRMEFRSLNAAQLHHMLREYEPRHSCAETWTPSSDETLSTADILESFDNHPPLVLPADGFTLELKRPIRDRHLITQLHHFLWTIRRTTGPEPSKPVSAVPMQAKLIRLEAHPKADLESVFPRVIGSCDALLTTNLEKKDETGISVSPDPSCLLTPPHTPHNLELPTPGSTGTHTPGLGTHTDASEECESGDEDVFVLELQRSACGLGLMLVDGQETPFPVSGIYIRSVLPDSPAALSRRLREGDRILAVNGLSLAGLDYQTSLELIQMSGDKPRLLVARSHSATSETRTKLSA